MSLREDTHARLVRLLQDKVVDTCSMWCDLVRQDAGRRLNHVGEIGPIEDPEYAAVLDAYSAIGEALDVVLRAGP
ncbi:hypothetical protein [Amycolatopsis magusensis]|uniref:hypothetical protein n=1 Tax=Amycolatopsis magusensis TaxID=882444 RepID=UPI0037B80463